MSELHTFLFDGLPVRGALVRLTDAWQELLHRRSGNTDTGSYPPPVANMLGQMAAAAVLMRGSIKFDGTLVLQVAGAGSVPVAVAEVDDQLRLRATATWRGEVAANASLAQLINTDGSGRCAITLDPRGQGDGRSAWQGVVPLVDATGAPLTSVAQMVAGYMQQSEQLDTTLVLAADAQAACGLMLQRMPGQDSDDGDAYNRLATLARSLGEQELLALDADAVLHRLFWNEPLQRLAQRQPRFHCSCSRQRVAAMLQGLGQAEVDGVLRERGEVAVACEFCGAQYRFDRIDVAALFSPQSPPPTGSEAVQ